MSIHRKAPKRDRNEREIIEVLTSIGASVTQLSGKGVPDLLIGFRGVTYLAEVKSKRGKLTDDQTSWRADWQGGPVSVIRNLDDALVLIGAVP